MTETERLLTELHDTLLQIREDARKFEFEFSLDDTELELHSSVAQARLDLGRLDAKLFSIYGLLQKRRQQSHYTYIPTPQPTRSFTVDDL